MYLDFRLLCEHVYVLIVWFWRTLQACMEGTSRALAMWACLRLQMCPSPSSLHHTVRDTPCAAPQQKMDDFRSDAALPPDILGMKISSKRRGGSAWSNTRFALKSRLAWDIFFGKHSPMCLTKRSASKTGLHTSDSDVLVYLDSVWWDKYNCAQLARHDLLSRPSVASCMCIQMYLGSFSFERL